MHRSPVYDEHMTEQMREPTYLLLTALAGGRQHGYGLVQDVSELSGGRVTLRAGTLYAALDRLAGEGLVVRDGEEVVSGRLRRYYTLSPAGRDVLVEQTAQRQALVRAAVVRLRALGVST